METKTTIFAVIVIVVMALREVAIAKLENRDSKYKEFYDLFAGTLKKKKGKSNE